jgi:hypothetical protein
MDGSLVSLAMGIAVFWITLASLWAVDRRDEGYGLSVASNQPQKAAATRPTDMMPGVEGGAHEDALPAEPHLSPRLPNRRRRGPAAPPHGGRRVVRPAQTTAYRVSGERRSAGSAPPTLFRTGHRAARAVGVARRG